MKRLLFLFLTISPIGFAQDFHYSQLDQSLTLINPATTSTFSGFERITLQHRNQWLGAGTQFMTSMGMSDFSIGKIARQKSRGTLQTNQSFDALARRYGILCV